MCDLDKAIELSGGQGKTASFAFTQRALILKMRGEKKKALEDFKKAADLGNLFAKKEVTHSMFFRPHDLHLLAYLASFLTVVAASFKTVKLKPAMKAMGGCLL